MANVLTKFIFDKVGVPRHRTYLDLAAFRHKLVSGNIANASTPGYKARSIEFQAEFDRLTGRAPHLPGVMTHAGHMPLGSHPAAPPDINEERIASGSMNSVDIDREVTDLAKNELIFTVGARLLQRKFEGLRNAITNKS